VPPPGTIYCFGGVVYASLTNESNAKLTMLAANGPGFTFPAGTGFEPLPEGVEPSGVEVAEASVDACRRLNDADGVLTPREVVFAGLGEPLLRLPELLVAVKALAGLPEVRSVRLNTNGLVPRDTAASVAAALRSAGLSRVCVQLQSADDAQHAALVEPLAGLSLADVRDFTRALVSAGIATECSAVGRPGVDTLAVDRLAAELGAESFKVRPYFP